MSNNPDDESKNETPADSNANQPKKKPDLDDLVRRLMRTQADVDAEKAKEDSSE